MFTGIIKEVASVGRIKNKGSLSKLEVKSGLIFQQSSLSDSIAVNGVCLTLVEKDKTFLKFDVAAPTLADTNLKFLKPGEPVNLEPALEVGEKLGGHFVLGHVDSMSRVKRIVDKNGYWEFELHLPRQKKYLIEKGSVALDGISLTVKKVLSNSFTVDVIPFTYQQTNLKFKKPGSWLNLEFDYLLKK